jgi:threonine dehydrogenase-like Zn-dependent dehydrogenase
MPVIPGHEIGGVIAEVGENVPAHLIPGLSCTINPYTACGNCPSCRNRRPNACRFNQTLGVQRDGAMREYMTVPWDKIIADSAVSPREFCLVEPMSVGFHAVNRGKVTECDTVMVLGCGMIGIGAIVSSALRGAQVIAVDVDDNKLLLAKQFGATYTINSQTENVHERLQAITDNSGPDVVIEAVGSPTTYQMAVNEVAFTGRIVCVGYAKEQIAFETKFFVQKELDICGSRNAMPEDFHTVIEYLKRKTCPVEKLISGIYKPEQVKEVFIRWTTEPAGIFRLLIEFES